MYFQSRMSSTPTLLRVKRRITDDPSDVLVLSATKRRKTNTDGESSGLDPGPEKANIMSVIV